MLYGIHGIILAAPGFSVLIRISSCFYVKNSCLAKTRSARPVPMPMTVLS